jgi:hypothetical protein
MDFRVLLDVDVCVFLAKLGVRVFDKSKFALILTDW